MSPLRTKSISRNKKVDPIGHSVFYPPGTYPSSPISHRPSLGRGSMSTVQSGNSAPATPPSLSPRRVPITTSKPPPEFYIADMPSLPGSPRRLYDLCLNDAVSPLDMTAAPGRPDEFPFPITSPSSLTPGNLADQAQANSASPHVLSVMIEKWNLATPPSHPSARIDSNTLGPLTSSSLTSISTTGTELRSPPDLPSSQGFHSRVLLSSESPSQILRQSIIQSMPKPPRRGSESPLATLTPRSPSAFQPPPPTTESPDLSNQSSGSRSPAPIPFRQPSWSNLRRGSVPAEVLGVQHVAQQNQLYYPSPPGLSSPPQLPPLTTTTPFTFANLNVQLDIPMRSTASPLGLGLFTPGYDMGAPSTAFPSSSSANALGLNLGHTTSQDPQAAGHGSFSIPHPAGNTTTSIYTQSTHASAPSHPAKSTVAAKHLENHILPAEFLRRYLIADELGSGGFGFVCSANMTGRGNEMGREVAVKFIFKERLEKTKDALVDGEPMESWVLRGCDHPNIIAWVDLFEDDRFFILVQELHGDPWSDDHTLHQAHHDPHTDPGGRVSLLQTPAYRSPSPLISPISPMRPYEVNPFDLHMTKSDGSVSRPRMGRRASHDLFEAVESVRFTEEEAKWIFKQIVSGVAYLHGKGIYHRDLKDENIVIDRYLNVKIIDFGSAVAEDHLQSPNLYGSFRGTYSYASPEVIQGSWYHASPCDIWSIGIILSILLTGEQPFPDKALALAGRFKLKKPTSEGARDLMEKMFRPDPTRRWGIEKVEKHRWLRNVKRPKHLPTPPTPMSMPQPQPMAVPENASRGFRTMWDGMTGSMGRRSPLSNMGPPPPPMADGAYRFGSLQAPTIHTTMMPTMPVRRAKGGSA